MFEALQKLYQKVGAISALNVTNDQILVYDASETRHKVRRITPRNFLLDVLGLSRTNGLAAVRLPLLLARCDDGAPLAAAAAAGDFGVTMTPGAKVVLIGEAAQNNTKTDRAYWEVRLPEHYVAGEDVTVTVNAEFDGSGTAGATKTVDVRAWEQAVNGTGVTDLCGTAAQAISAAAGDYAFVLDGDNLLPGDVILLEVTIALQESGDVSPINAVLNSVRVS